MTERYPHAQTSERKPGTGRYQVAVRWLPSCRCGWTAASVKTQSLATMAHGLHVLEVSNGVPSEGPTTR